MGYGRKLNRKAKIISVNRNKCVTCVGWTCLLFKMKTGQFARMHRERHLEAYKR